MQMTRKTAPPTLRPVPSESESPTHSTEAEQNLLGVLLVDSSRLPEVAGLVADKDFYYDANRRLYRHILEMADAGETIDIVTVFNRITQHNDADAVGGLPYIGELANTAQPSARIDAYARIIADHARRRALAALASDIAKIATSAGSTSAAARIAKATQLLQDMARQVVPEQPQGSVLEVEPATVGDPNRVFADELVEDVLTEYGVSVVYGASNSGKTFFAIDLAAAIARGIGWNGKATRKAGVLYLATESPASVKHRLAAYMAHHDLEMLDVFVAAKPINLYESDADVERVVSEMAYIRQQFGVEIGLIIGDTMARIAAGANENAGEDMGVVMANADKMCRATRCAFMWIHHSGKDEAKGARGWSGIRAHIDTEIEIKDADDQCVHSAEITKQRDLSGKGTRFGFRLQVHRLGLNRWGNVRTTCVVVPEVAPAKVRGGRPNESEGSVLLFLRERGSGARASDIVDGLEGILPRRSVYRAIRTLKDAGKLSCVSGIYASTGAGVP